MSTVIDRIVREPEATHMTGLGRTRRNELSLAGQFPRKVRLSDRASGYRLSELQAWIDSRPRADEVEADTAAAARVVLGRHRSAAAK